MLQFFETQKVKFSFALTYVLAFFLILYNMLNLFQNILIELPFPFSSFELSLRFSLAFILTSGFISALEWIKSTNDKLEEIKKLNVSEIEFKERELRSTRARISAALHGPIQGRLAGIAMALRFNELEKGKSELLLSRIYQDLIPQLDLISGDLQEIFDGKNPRKNDLSLEKNLIDLESEWGFLLNIDWKLSKDLAASQNARFIDDILLICNEAIANSVRHGNASQVSLEISKLDNVVILSIIDNGTGVLKGFVGSMGLETIRGISTDYSLTNVENGGAKLSISLPLEKYLDQLI
jgi:signal transduction histidine kinase